MIYENDYLEEYLQHHGIKGMKWGVRRPVGSNGLIMRTAGKLKTYRRAKMNSAVKTIGKASRRIIKGSDKSSTKKEKKSLRILDAYSNKTAKEVRQNNKNSMFHPIISTQEQFKMIAKSPASLLFPRGSELRDVNANVARRVAEKKKKKKKKG